MANLLSLIERMDVDKLVWDFCGYCRNSFGGLNDHKDHECRIGQDGCEVRDDGPLLRGRHNANGVGVLVYRLLYG